MRNITYLLILIAACFISNVITYADATDDKNKLEAQIDNIKDTLTFGIEDEVKMIIGSSSIALSQEYMQLLFNRYKEAKITLTKIAIVNYLTRISTKDDYFLNFLYNEAVEKKTDPQLKSAIFYYLSEHGSENEQKLLIDSLDANDDFLKNAASSALKKVKSETILNALMERLNKDLEMRSSDDNDYKPLPDDIIYNMILTFGDQKYANSISYLRNVISNKNSKKFAIMYAMSSLAKIGDLQSLNQIYSQLSNTDEKIQEYAAYAISCFNDQSAIPILTEMLKHNTPKVRYYACKGILLNKNTTFIDALIYKIKKDPEGLVKKEALKTLILLGTPGISAYEKLYEPAKVPQPHLYIISEAVSSAPDTDNVNYLIKLYNVTDKAGKNMIAANVVKSTSNFIDPIIKILFTSEDYLIRIGAINSILNIKETTLLPEVKKIYETDKLDVIKKNAKRVIDFTSK